MVLSCLVMVIRPRETEPVPRYCVTVIEAIIRSVLAPPSKASGSERVAQLTVDGSLDARLPMQMAVNTVGAPDDLPELCEERRVRSGS